MTGSAQAGGLDNDNVPAASGGYVRTFTRSVFDVNRSGSSVVGRAVTQADQPIMPPVRFMLARTTPSSAMAMHEKGMRISPLPPSAS